MRNYSRGARQQHAVPTEIPLIIWYICFGMSWTQRGGSSDRRHGNT